MKSSHSTKANISTMKWKHSTNNNVLLKKNVDCCIVEKPIVMRRISIENEKNV
jgi:hypothetical protein